MLGKSCTAMGAGWVPVGASPPPTQPFNATQGPLCEAACALGNGESPVGHSPPASLFVHAAARLRPPNSSQQWPATPSLQPVPAAPRPCPRPPLLLAAPQRLRERLWLLPCRQAMRGGCPDKHTLSMGQVVKPGGCRAPAWGYNLPPQTDGGVWVMEVPEQKSS